MKIKKFFKFYYCVIKYFFLKNKIKVFLECNHFINDAIVYIDWKNKGFSFDYKENSNVRFSIFTYDFEPSTKHKHCLKCSAEKAQKELEKTKLAARLYLNY